MTMMKTAESWKPEDPAARASAFRHLAASRNQLAEATHDLHSACSMIQFPRRLSDPLHDSDISHFESQVLPLTRDL